MSIPLQQLYSEVFNESEREYLKAFLKQHGYEFADYTPELGEFFEFSQANVPTATTTYPAIRNIKTKEVAVRGFVVFPRV